VAVNVVKSTKASRTKGDLFFIFNLLLILLYDQYRGVVSGMLDGWLINI
jgi:hypothetical protein